jgi:Predicted acyltransferases
MRQLNWFDLSQYRNKLYGFSILWIFIFHISESFKKQMDFGGLFDVVTFSGNMGVEIFLFLSGVSLYFSMSKLLKDKKDVNEITMSEIFNFYKRRVRNIIILYIVFCIPALYISDIAITGNVELFFHHVFFFNEGCRTYWFLLAIIIFYLIYPTIFKLIKQNKKKRIYVFLVVYSIILVYISYIGLDFYEFYEVMLTRLPIFVIGSLCGEAVYNKKSVNSYILIFLFVGAFLRRPILYCFENISFLKFLYPIVFRYSLAIPALCVMFVLCMLFPYFKGKVVDDFLPYIGKMTLEIYVVHIGLRAIFRSYLRDLNALSKNEVFIFMIILFILTIFLSIFLNKLLHLRNNRNT